MTPDKPADEQIEAASSIVGHVWHNCPNECTRCAKVEQVAAFLASRDRRLSESRPGVERTRMLEAVWAAAIDVDIRVGPHTNEAEEALRQALCAIYELTTAHPPAAPSEDAARLR